MLDRRQHNVNSFTSVNLGAVICRGTEWTREEAPHGQADDTNAGVAAKGAPVMVHFAGEAEAPL